MFKRFFEIENKLDEAMFLFGARQTGKSTLLKERFPDAVYYDLLDTDVRKRFQRDPQILKELVFDKLAGTLIIIDEIQKVPELLDVVHSLMVEKQLQFILSGSSARKLKRSGANTLGGRAIPETLFPLVSAEIPDFDISKALQNGLIPRHYLVGNATKRLQGYVEVYLQEEILEEAAVNNIDIFERFMEVAAISDGEIINYANIASDCRVSVNTIKSYFKILYDSLIGYEVPAYRKVVKRKLQLAPKFYYFDVGIVNYLLKRMSLSPGTPEFGHAFEHLVVQEIIAWLGYSDRKKDLSYWHTYSGLEVDAILGDATVAIEIKSTYEVQTKHKTGLNRFAEEHPEARLILVSMDKLSRKSGNIELLYIKDFLKLLWSGEIY